MKGRKPKPIPLKKLAGNPGKRKLNAKEPRLPAKKISTRALNARAKKFFDLHSSMLREAKVLTDADVKALEFMSIHQALVHRAAEIIKRDGEMIWGAKGGEIKHPMFQVMRDNSMMFLRYAVEFGMTPSSRGRLQVEGEGDVDPFEEFVKQRLGDPA